MSQAPGALALFSKSIGGASQDGKGHTSQLRITLVIQLRTNESNNTCSKGNKHCCGRAPGTTDRRSRLARFASERRSRFSMKAACPIPLSSTSPRSTSASGLSQHNGLESFSFRRVARRGFGEARRLVGSCSGRRASVQTSLQTANIGACIVWLFAPLQLAHKVRRGTLFAGANDPPTCLSQTRSLYFTSTFTFVGLPFPHAVLTSAPKFHLTLG